LSWIDRSLDGLAAARRISNGHAAADSGAAAAIVAPSARLSSDRGAIALGNLRRARARCRWTTGY
jgi:hypothetical protein